jgi:hypothetical protein
MSRRQSLLNSRRNLIKNDKIKVYESDKGLIVVDIRKEI